MLSATPEIAVEMLAQKQANEPAPLEGPREIAAPVAAINPDFKPNDQASFSDHDIELLVMSDVGHLAMMEDPDTFNHLLEATIGNLSTPT